MRLSRDDEKNGESLSIENQRILLTRFVNERGGTVTDEYIDDGWSGTDFERPAVKRLLSDAQTGKIDTIVVKDLSRFGRNYIQVGQYIDYIFPAYGIRFIAISDGVDTAVKDGNGMDMMPIMNVFNEWHAANTSKKIRAVLEAKQRSGIYTNWSYPYGYKVGNDESRSAVIDGQSAEVVRRIFNLRIQGNSVRSIAKILSDEGIPNPATYFTRADGKKSDRRCSPLWTPKTVAWILSNPTYIGRLIQHKTTSISYKNHKVVKVPERDRIVKENAHQAIISRDIWDRVQKMNGGVSRGRVDKKNKIHPLSGLIYCPDCGKKFKLSSYKSKGGASFFVCRTYADLGKSYCLPHRIAESVIENIVLTDIRSMLGSAEFNAQEAKARFLKDRAKRNLNSRASTEKQLNALKNRLVELDKLIGCAFEQRVLRGMSEGVFASLCTKYQAEREEVQNSILKAEERLSKTEDEEVFSSYEEKLKSYASCDTLTREMCIELISLITLGEKTISGRKIAIYYKFKGKD